MHTEHSTLTSWKLCTLYVFTQHGALPGASTASEASTATDAHMYTRVDTLGHNCT
jgi:hypothetical protein